MEKSLRRLLPVLCVLSFVVSRVCRPLHIFLVIITHRHASVADHAAPKRAEDLCL